MKEKIKKFLKYFFIIFLIFLFLLSTLPFVFKKQIVSFVKNEINQQLNAEVDFKYISISFLKFFPDLTFKIKDFYIVGQNEFRNDTLIFVEDFFIGFNVKKLLKKRFEISDVALKNVDVFIKILPDGYANYDIVNEQEQQTADTASSVLDTTKIKLNRLIIKNLSLKYLDMQEDYFLKTENLNLTLKGNFSEAVSDFYLKFNAEKFSFIYENLGFLNDVNLFFEGNFTADLQNETYTFRDNHLDVNDLKLKFAGLISYTHNDDLFFDLKIETANTDFKTLLSLIPAFYKKDLQQIQTEGNFQLSGYLKGILSETSIPAYALFLEVNDAMLKFSFLPQAIEKINIKASVQGFSENYFFVNVEKLDFSAVNNTVSSHLFFSYKNGSVISDLDFTSQLDLSTIKDFYPLDSMDFSGKLSSKLVINGKLENIEQPNLENLLVNGNIDLENFTANFYDYPQINLNSLNLNLKNNDIYLKINDLSFKNSHFNLDGNVLNVLNYIFKDETISANLNLSSDYVDIDDFFAFYASDTITTSETDLGNDTLAFQLPQNIQVSLSLDVKKLKYENLEMQNITGKANLKDNKIELEDLNFTALDGNIALKGYYDFTNYLQPQAFLDYDMSEINVSEIYNLIKFTEDLSPVLKNAKGRVSMGLWIKGTLNYKLEIIPSTLDAEGFLKTNEISIEGNKFFKLLSISLLNKDLSNPTLKNLNLKFRIENGNLFVPKTNFVLSGLQGYVEGRSNLDKTLDFDLGLKLKKEKVGQILSLPLENIRDNFYLKIKVGGTIDNPKIVKIGSNITPSVKFKEDLSEEAKKHLEQIRKKADKIIENAERQRDSILQEAYKQAEKIEAEAQKQANTIIEEARNKIKPYQAKLKNPALKKWAQKQIDKIMKQAQKKANKIIADANKKSDQIINNARKKGDKLVEDARKRAKKMINEAERKYKR